MKNLCLDIGNVLCEVDLSSYINLLSLRLNLSKEEVWYFLNRVQRLHDLGLTNLSDELRDHFKIKSEIIIDELNNTWNNCIIPNYNLIEKINQLVEKLNIEVALLSNIGYEHAAVFNEKVSMPKAIKHFSCFVGARKPTLLYYQSFLQQYPQFKNSVYIDDLKENLAAGASLGFNSIHFTLEEKKETLISNKYNSAEEVDIYLADKLIKKILVANNV